jgi:hypothetical protein
MLLSRLVGPLAVVVGAVSLAWLRASNLATKGMTLMRFALGLALAALATTASACTAPATSAPAPEPVVVASVGLLTVDWSINGTKDPSQCSQGAASAIEITVTDANLTPIGTFQQSCTALATSITLEAGRYEAQARLIDAVGTPRTTIVNINPFIISGNDDFNAPIDFSASSFF